MLRDTVQCNNHKHLLHPDFNAMNIDCNGIKVVQNAQKTGYFLSIHCMHQFSYNWFRRNFRDHSYTMSMDCRAWGINESNEPVYKVWVPAYLWKKYNFDVLSSAPSKRPI